MSAAEAIPRRRARLRLGVLASVVVLGLVAAACGSDDDSSAPASTEGGHAAVEPSAAVELRQDLRTLWSDHMQWTYATVDAFFHDPDALQPTLDRLLANQADLGAAIVPFYGEEAGDQLTELLTTHIKQAVPVLQAAQAGDDAALQTALGDWKANAQQVADFLTEANPDSWPQSATRPALEMHIDQTTAYAVDLLKGDFAKAIEDYDAAYDHMAELADILAAGLVAQFPDRFQG